VLTDGPAIHVPAFAVDAVDPTAAGDAFTAALTVRWLATGNILDAVRYGNAAGSLAASKLGAQASLPFRSAVDMQYDGGLDQ
jgi:ribokinase